MRQIEQAKESTIATTSTITTTTTRDKKKHLDEHRKRQFYKLIEACKCKDLATIQELLGEHPELSNYHDKYNRNLLHYVSITTSGLDTSEKGYSNERIARSKSYRSANESASLKCFRYLLAHCQPKLYTERDQNGLTALHLAVISCNVTLVRELLNGQDELRVGREQLAQLASALDKEHHGPLHWAVITNNIECVKLLIEHSGVQLAHQPDLNGATPLHYATQTSDYPKYRAQLRQMLKNATSSHLSETFRSSSSSSSSSTTIGSTSSSIGDSLHEVEKKQKYTSENEALNSALQRSNTTKTKTKTREQEVVNGRSFDGTESCSAHLVTGPTTSVNNLYVLRYLVHLPDVNLECCDRDLRTPLLWAASSGNRGAILVLLGCGANPLCQDANKLGPLHCAASHGYTDCLECLLTAHRTTAHVEHSGLIDQCDNLNCTPLFYAVLSGNIDCVELLLDRGARHDWQDVKGRTAAHFGALKGQLNTLKLLEAHGANLWLANKQGDLPLHYAIKSGRQQVVGWLLERSPYECAVNAINNTGRAPIHLALLRGNTPMVEFLVGQGANLNQLVKVKETGTTTNKSAAGADNKQEEEKVTRVFYRYETALDMAKRLNVSECVELLERNSAKSAAWVLAHREERFMSSAKQMRQVTNNRSLFDVQADEVGASPIGFETSGSSAEPAHSVSEPSAATRLPKIPAPRQVAPLVETTTPQLGDSTNSSALSQSSLTSVRGEQHPATPADKRPESQTELGDDEPTSHLPRSETRPRPEASAGNRRPYRGGINYQNERINASIKCKLYENGQHSFPPSSELNNRRHAHRAPHHSAGSPNLPGANGVNQQEIITNVNVYTTSPRCVHCGDQEDQPRVEQLMDKDCAMADHARTQTNEMAPKRTCNAQRGGLNTRRANSQRDEFSETSDTSDATSEILYDDDSDRGLDERAYQLPLPPLGGIGVGVAAAAPAAPAAAAAKAVHTSDRMAPAQAQQQVRYLPPSRAYKQHLPVILSAEEERSTSGDTNNTAVGRECESVSPGDVEMHQLDSNYQRQPRRPAARRLDQVRSPVAEYIRSGGGGDPAARSHTTSGDVRGWPHQGQSPRSRPIDQYSQVRAKVDSYRNDSGLSMSHFGDDLADGLGSSGGRRSKSWSTPESSHQQARVAAAVDGHLQHDHYHTSGYSPSPPIGGAGDDELAMRNSRSCSQNTQTIIRTRRLSVDSVELATSVERSIRKYKQESKLFEELQNLKRSQIRSGRANESLLVKRLVERFRREIQLETLIGLDAYHGSYTYQAYELYLYDQLRKISQSNRAKLAGARVPHKFTYQESRLVALDASGQLPTRATASEAKLSQEARDFFEEDLKAELELQRVIQRSEIALREQTHPTDPVVGNRSESDLLLIEPNGALDDIRVRESGKPESTKQVDEHKVSADNDEQQAGEGSQPEVDIPANQLEKESEKDGCQGRALTGSSAASSRRSSVEVEREKLEKIPLRVADDNRKEDNFEQDLSALAIDKERRLIESQALDLTTAIITDALGNVSRATSPVGQRKQVAASDDANYQDEIKQDENNELLEQIGKQDTTAEPKDDQQASQEEEQANNQRATSVHGRRRSVVNIGNKLEVIYHNVGIEIDTVGENPTSDDENEILADTSAEQNNSKSKTIDETVSSADDDDDDDDGQAVKLDKVHELEGEDDELSSRQGQEFDRREGNDEVTYKDEIRKDARVPDSNSFQNEDDEHQLESAAHTPGSSIVELEPAQFESTKMRENALAQPSATFTRRASSPQGGGASKRARPPAPASRRRLSVDSSLHHPSTSDMIVVQRKIFNGFDLDSLHAHRRKHFASENSRGEIATSLGHKSNDECAHNLSEHKDKLRTVQTTRTKPKQRLIRSRLPLGPYKVYVPTELIRKRWHEVKRHESQRKRKLQEDEISALVTCHSTPAAEIIEHSKSQTNLRDRVTLRPSSESTGESSTQSHKLTADREGSNFILIYELNKSASEQTALATSKGDEEARRRRAQIEQVNWCQRRITKIVDVRTLKRTLSLPECLIYSNDLLKRFSILKL